MVITPSPQRSEVHTRDRDVAAEAVNRIVAHEARVRWADPRAVDLVSLTVSYGDLTAVRLRFSGVHYSAWAPRTPALFAGAFTEGHAEIRLPDQHLRLGPRDVVLYPEGLPAGVEYDNSAHLFLAIPQAVVADVAEETIGVPAADLRFTSGLPVSPAGRRLWTQTVSYLGGQLTAPGSAHPPLVVEQFLRHAAAALLTVFPNTTMTVAHLSEPGRVAPAAVRRALAFMEAHADQPLTVTQIAAALGIGARDLREAFRRHLGTTPPARLRRIRLERVHRELQTADPTGRTVAEIARRWGFADPARFASYYLARYGIAPSRTLGG
jgi:AraC-like DNA-binding protein